MTVTKHSYYDGNDWVGVLVGKSIVAANMTTGTLSLSDGTVLEFDKENSDCCSWIELAALATTANIITAAKVETTDDDEGPYTAWVHVVTEAGELRVVEANADASNGYYLHGFALGVKVTTPEVQA